MQRSIDQVSALPPRHEISDTPFFPQTQYQCGAAALATVINYRGHKIEPSQLEPLLFIPRKKGSLSIELVAQARQQGLVAYPLAPRLEDIIKEIDANNPVLVFQNLGFTWLPQWHYAVVVGYDQKAQTLTLRSGTEKRRIVSMRAFMNTWERADHWAIVIVPPDKPTATAKPIPWLQATSSLELFVPKAAEKAYLAALDQWPDNTEVDNLARLGMANIAYQEADYPRAKEWLLRGNGPVSANQWNNLAYTFMALKCPNASLQTIQCALKKYPEHGGLKNSQQELLERSHHTMPISQELCANPAC